ncbi:related to UPF0187 domain membrane protein [Cephalotrichum gorgonifer]|uniref:Related to UPF0187 domain membrane protein n=1 Tax=Cephalotrichum gorgonifer TaxID=2041049 RepID=A0AAE8MT84_9PEZI|nr:related to UPF0187 domain membrane protein [Cephalotrichum gorgonifer]
MGEDGGPAPSAGATAGVTKPAGPLDVPGSSDGPHPAPSHRPGLSLGELPKASLEEILSPTGATTPTPFGVRSGSLDLDDYFAGPRDIGKHSKWPLFLRMHGSITPKLILPLLFVGGWATAITLICEKVYDLGIDSILLTVTGFVVGLSLSFRSSTAYERYSEGRKYWAQVINASQTLGRIFWVHSREKDRDDPEKIKSHLLHTMTCSNLIVAFAIALKHKLRFEPYTAYDDLSHLVAHLDTFAGAATAVDPSAAVYPPKNWFKGVGERLGVSFAESNPRKALKKARKPLGNLPLEILNYLGRYLDLQCLNGNLPIPMQQTLAYNNLGFLNDSLTHTDRVLNTPLPIAYTISISQITWVYIMLLPFQLYPRLEWVTIPATVAASYIILGLLFIGREIENPFGQDVNDLPLDQYCEQIATELDVIAAQSMGLENLMAQVDSAENRVLFPVSSASFKSWKGRSEGRLRAAIRSKPAVSFAARCHHTGEVQAKSNEGSVTGEEKV